MQASLCKIILATLILGVANSFALDFYPSSQFLGTNFLRQTNAANADLTNAQGIAPNLPTPAAFATPPVAQTLTIAAVAGTGSSAANYYFTLPFDANGSPYQFGNGNPRLYSR